MYNLKLISHKDIKSEELYEIIAVKSVAWPYHFQKQLDWINLNIKNNDIHVLLYFDELLVAYLNLIKIEFSVDQIVKQGYGIGNVCALEKNKGFGKEMITKTNTYFVQNNKIGLLFCKDQLVEFYKKREWMLIEKKKVTLSFDATSINTMLYNLDEEFRCIEFLGKSF